MDPRNALIKDYDRTCSSDTFVGLIGKAEPIGENGEQQHTGQGAKQEHVDPSFWGRLYQVYGAAKSYR